MIATVYPVRKKKHNPYAAAGTDYVSEIEFKNNQPADEVLTEPITRQLFLMLLGAQPRGPGLSNKRDDLQATRAQKQRDRSEQIATHNRDHITPGSGLL